MKHDAIEKINAVMQKTPNCRYTEVLGQYLIDRCGDDVVAAAVLAEGKTLTGAMREVTAAARKQAVGNCAVMLPDAVFDIVDTYFGLAHDEGARLGAMVGFGGKTPAAAVSGTPNGLDLDFESLL